ncbi:Glycosyl transferase family 2 [Caulifigura coniformis]|uniref:Glycosyl transferase family 2 n=1 Tax=Caulifigura coniformis TaxID=2527983 RepID=A0A517S7R9_9PLAN|nr:glycosyltransferase [Caulifigura coniformis]QDT52166.1 Glycosyl transferase family 2 [Caulifigura coniformis]
MRTAIVMAQHGQPQLTIACLQTLRRHHGDEPPVVLVDDGSPPGDLEQVLAAAIANLQIVRRPHRGVTAAWNAGAACCTADVLIFLNNDVITTGPWADRLADLLVDRRIAVAGVERRRERHVSPEVLSRLPTGEFAAGWCFAVRRSDFEAIHSYRSALRLYFSDTDLQSRLLVRGGTGGEGIAAVPLPLKHLGHATTSACTTRHAQWQADRRRFQRLWKRGGSKRQACR